MDIRKGVVCLVEEDENMPVDKDGNVVDIITGQDSIPGRMNIGRLIEPYLNAAARDVRREIMEKSGLGRYTTYVTREQFEALPPDRMAYFVSEYLKFHWIASPTMALEYEQYLNDEERVQWLLKYINDKPYLHRMVNFPVDARTPEGELCNYNDEKAEAIERHWNLVYDTVSYVTRNGVREETVNKVRVMPIYIQLLDKIGDHALAVDMGKLSIFGLLAPRNDGDKHDSPYKRTPPRTVGETEGALYNLYGGREMIAETLDRNGSLETQLEIARNFYHSKTPTNIDRIVDRKKNPLGKYRPVQIVKHMFEVAGAGFEYSPEKE